MWSRSEARFGFHLHRSPLGLLLPPQWPDWILSSPMTDQVLSADSSDLGALFGIDLGSPAKTSRTQSADKPAKKPVPTRARVSRSKPTAAESAAEQQVAALKTLLKRVKSSHHPAPA